MKSRLRRVLVGLLIMSVFAGSSFSSAYAETMPTGETPPIGEDPVQSDFTVVSFEELSTEIKVQNLNVGDESTKIVLPTTLVANLQNGEKTSISPITWEIDKAFNNSVSGTFTYTAVLPDTFTYAADVSVPSISVTVNKAVSTLLSLNSTIDKVAGTTLWNTIWVRPAYGRTIYLQKYNSTLAIWETKKTYTLSNVLVQEMDIAYPSEWYSLNQATTQWRIYMPETSSGDQYTSPTVTINAIRAYQNPASYYQIQPSVTLRSNAGYALRYGSMGLKVAAVQRKLGMGRIWEIIGPTTYSKIKAYQKRLGLPQTGTVNYTLWRKMGFSDNYWYNAAAYVSPLKTGLASTKTQFVEAFISNAYRYIGTEYIVGAAGAPKTGVDCSGLVMQSMYATGVDPYPISVIRHSQPGYEYESRNFWASTKLKAVAVKDRARGDLIFYQNKAGTVIHVAIYLGNNKVIESVPSGVKVSNMISLYSNIKGVKRVFN